MILVKALSDTVIPLHNVEGWPAPPFLVVLGGGLPNVETVRVVAKSLNTLTVERAHEGVRGQRNTMNSVRITGNRASHGMNDAFLTSVGVLLDANL